MSPWRHGGSSDVRGIDANLRGLYQFNVVVPNLPASDTTPLTFTLNGTPGTQTLNLFIGN